jgi:hypothetical protein
MLMARIFAEQIAQILTSANSGAILTLRPLAARLRTIIRPKAG